MIGLRRGDPTLQSASTASLQAIPPPAFWMGLLVLLAIGAVVRVVIAFAFVGHAFDIGSLALVLQNLRTDPLHLYRSMNDVPIFGGALYFFRWPYPPGYFPAVLAAGYAHDALGLPFSGLIKLPSVLADIAIAYVVQDFLRSRGTSPRARQVAAGVIVLGPVFIFISAYHGQIDSTAILPAVLAVVLWERDHPQRALLAGLLIGVGAAIKTVPILMLFALLPSARTARERTALIATAVGVPLLALTPFLLADSSAVLRVLRYPGVAGVGGISLLLQPSLAKFWLSNAAIVPSGTTLFLFRWGSTVTAVVMLLVCAALLRQRTDAVNSAVIIWLAFYTLASGFAFQYLIWGLPFFLVAGHRRGAAAIQLLVIVPIIALTWRPPLPHLAAVYVIVMATLWLAFGVALVSKFRAAWVDGQRSTPGLISRAQPTQNPG